MCTCTAYAYDIVLVSTKARFTEFVSSALLSPPKGGHADQHGPCALSEPPWGGARPLPCPVLWSSSYFSSGQEGGAAKVSRRGTGSPSTRAPSFAWLPVLALTPSCWSRSLLPPPQGALLAGLLEVLEFGGLRAEQDGRSPARESVISNQ